MTILMFKFTKSYKIVILYKYKYYTRFTNYYDVCLKLCMFEKQTEKENNSGILRDEIRASSDLCDVCQYIRLGSNDTICTCLPYVGT